MTLSYIDAAEGFLGLEGDDAFTPTDAKAVIVPFGLEKTTSYGAGTGEGPSAILQASHQVELFDEEVWSEPFRNYGIATLAETIIPERLEDALTSLEHTVEAVLEAGKFPLILGGEHSLTAGSIRPFAKRYDDLVVLQFDAHADLRNGYEGEHYSHAAAMCRVLDHSNISLVSVGIRNISAEEIPFLEENRNRINIFWAKDMPEWNIEELINLLRDKSVYITFDLDGFDSSLMPATGTPEPGGLFFNDAIRILRAVSSVSTIVGADIVELAPIRGMHACNFLAAKLCYKMLTCALSSGE